MPESPVMQIGVYQLRNLVQQNVVFQFLDLRGENSSLEKSELLKNAVKVSSQGVLEHLHKLGLSTQDPVVLICEDGFESQKVAQVLQDQGYINVFVVERGIAALIA